MLLNAKQENKVLELEWLANTSWNAALKAGEVGNLCGTFSAHLSRIPVFLLSFMCYVLCKGSSIQRVCNFVCCMWISTGRASIRDRGDLG